MKEKKVRQIRKRQGGEKDERKARKDIWKERDRKERWRERQERYIKRKRQGGEEDERKARKDERNREESKMKGKQGKIFEKKETGRRERWKERDQI